MFYSFLIQILVVFLVVGVAWAESPRVESLIVRLRSTSTLQSTDAVSPIKKLYPNAKVWTPKLYVSKRGGSLMGVAETVLLEVPEGADAEAMAKELSLASGVLSAEPNYPVVAMGGGDPLRYLQGHLYATRLASLKGLIAYREVLVAIVDSGVDYYHQDLKDQIYRHSQETLNGVDDDNNGFVDDLYGYDFYGFYKGEGNANPNDALGHGTHIAGIVGAKADNQVGVEGVASYVKLLNVRFLDSRGFGNQYDAAAAIRYAVDMGAKIINCSWGYFRSTSVLDEALQYALDQGVLVVAAAGNSGSSVLEYPAAYPGVVAVGAVTLSDAKAYFSSFGKVDTAMYGDAIYSTLPNNRYGSMSGTSQSAGMVTGVLARIWAYFPEESSANIASRYLAACTNPNQIAGVGQGIFSSQTLYSTMAYEPNDHNQHEVSVVPVDVSRTTSLSSDTLTIENLHSFPNPHVSTTAYIGFESSRLVSVTVKIFDLDGRLKRTLETVASPGYNRVPWDLLTDTGELLKNGSYLYVLEATSGEDTQIKRGRFAVLL